MEAICDAFDRNVWESVFSNAAQGTAMTGPAKPTGLSSWELRTAWCYWIDNHLAKIGTNVGSRLNTGKTYLKL
ncbi:hypothetical protein N7520_004948 [Penicillium odoratum]|uniref:uncharacterized protein n=1 Tax=Penicillium odoratum TaxID=1167516 RepID=UPI002549A2E7|nr:uncharacterized protein N7520_004948 [Penicillium odoratum]KAJ5765389.1 hypothetical protein N7520_004948 [Penicillium odoratum]